MKIFHHHQKHVEEKREAKVRRVQLILSFLSFSIGRQHYFSFSETESTSSAPNFDREQELGDFLEKNVKSAYSRGDIVWAKINGYSFWPAMIDDDPDIKMCFWSDDLSTTPVNRRDIFDYRIFKNRFKSSFSFYTQTHYHVVFFDAKNRLSRSWCKPNQIKAYGTAKVSISEKHYNAYKVRFRESVRQADEALLMSVSDRIKRFSFLSRKKKPGTQLCQD